MANVSFWTATAIETGTDNMTVANLSENVKLKIKTYTNSFRSGNSHTLSVFVFEPIMYISPDG